MYSRTVIRFCCQNLGRKHGIPINCEGSSLVLILVIETKTRLLETWRQMGQLGVGLMFGDFASAELRLSRAMFSHKIGLSF